MRHWKNWQIILAVVVAALTMLGILYTAISNYIGTQHRVEELGNTVADLSTPESAKSTMCEEQNSALVRSIEKGDMIARGELTEQMDKMGCYELAVQPSGQTSENNLENDVER